MTYQTWMLEMWEVISWMYLGSLLNHSCLNVILYSHNCQMPFTDFIPCTRCLNTHTCTCNKVIKLKHLCIWQFYTNLIKEKKPETMYTQMHIVQYLNFFLDLICEILNIVASFFNELMDVSPTYSKWKHQMLVSMTICNIIIHNSTNSKKKTLFSAEFCD